MDELVTGLKDFIKSEKLFKPEERVLVAVSGGVDSMVLAHLIRELGYDIAVAHVNFQLRDTSSELDEQLVKETASKWGVVCHSRKVETTAYAKELGISTEMAARELRYQWFQTLAEQEGYHKIATAHHLNDVLETLILNLAKGTGIAGLHGILPQRDLIVRPLLFAKKEDIVIYAKNKELSWRHDESNENNYYQRNLIRNKIIPILKKINPNLEKSAQNTSEIIRSVEKLYSGSIKQLRNELFHADGPHIVINKKDIASIEAPVIKDLLNDYGFNYDQCKSLMRGAFDQSGKIFESISHILNVDRNKILISPKISSVPIATINENCYGTMEIDDQEWVISEYHGEMYGIRPETWIGAFDLDQLSFPLKVRNWLPGDRFCPLGMTHFKKISDFLVDTKVPLNHKSRIQVLVSDQDIIWVVGCRIDNRYKVTENTKRILEINIKQG